MAMTCISGARECTGCMTCQEEEESVLHCSICGCEIDCDLYDVVAYDPICAECQEVLSSYDEDEPA